MANSKKKSVFKLLKGFTLVELLIVIAVLAVLASSAIVLLNPQQQIRKANDARRKSDLNYVTHLLNLYYNDHGKYPAPNPGGGCDYGTTPQCYVYSTSGSSWIGALVPNYSSSLPIDPINNSADPRIDGHYSYAYGGVSQDGQHYDLFVQLENKSDPDRCELKQYLYNYGFGTPTSWCPLSSNSNYYLFQLSHE